MRRAPASTRQDVLEGPRNRRGAPGVLVHSQEAVALDAAADLEGVARCACFRGQRTDCQIAIELLEDLQARPQSVLAQQAFELLQPRSYPARRYARQIHAGAVLEIR